MRTTINLPDDLHQMALSLSRDKSMTLSEAVAFLLQKALRGEKKTTQKKTRQLASQSLRFHPAHFRLITGVRFNKVGDKPKTPCALSAKQSKRDS